MQIMTTGQIGRMIMWRTAECWNQGEGGKNNSNADIYWAKVSGVNPTTGKFTAPQVTINMILLFKITFVAMMFAYKGGRFLKLVVKELGDGGYRFIEEGGV